MASSASPLNPAGCAAPGSATGTGILVHRPVRAHPRPVPATPLTVAAPPTVGWAASPLAGWLQYLVPLVGSGGSVAFLFAVPGPRPGWLVALVIGAAAAHGAATSPTSPGPHNRPTTWPRPSSLSRSTSTPAQRGSGRPSPRPTACGSAVPPTPTSSPSGSAAARSLSPPRPASTPPTTPRRARPRA